LSGCTSMLQKALSAEGGLQRHGGIRTASV